MNRILAAALLLSMCLILSRTSASQIAFDYIGTGDNANLTAFSISVTTPLNSEYGKIGVPYQPLQSERVDSFSALILGGMPGTNNPPDEADWQILQGRWFFQIWSVPASAPPVDTGTSAGVVPAIVHYYWQQQPLLPEIPPPGNYRLLGLTPVGGIPTRAGLTASGRQKWLVDLDLSTQDVFLDPSRVYMFELSTRTVAPDDPVMYALQTNLEGPGGVRLGRTLTQPPFPPQVLSGPPAYRLTIANVPEPSTWALALCGLCGASFLAWRGRRDRSRCFL